MHTIQHTSQAAAAPVDAVFGDAIATGFLLVIAFTVWYLRRQHGAAAAEPVPVCAADGEQQPG